MDTRARSRQATAVATADRTAAETRAGSAATSDALSPAPTTSTEGSGTTTAAEIAQLQAELDKFNQLKEARVLRLRIQAAQRELSALENSPDPPGPHQERAGTEAATTPPRRGSRPIPDEGSDSDRQFTGSKRHCGDIDAPRPTQYKGENRRALVGWIRSCEHYFDVRHHQYPDNKSKVIMARGYLAGPPQAT